MEIKNLKNNELLFPKQLNHLNEINYIGNINLLKTNCIAVVGKRACSETGLNITEEAVKQLVTNNVTIVSGYAKGVDQTASFNALKHNGNTIIVLPNGLNHFKILDQFKSVWKWSNILIISEFNNNEQWSAKNAYTRNKTVINLSSKVFIIESNNYGGTFNTGNETLKLKKPLYVINYDNNPPTGNTYFLNNGAIPVGKNKLTNLINIQKLINHTENNITTLGKTKITYKKIYKLLNKPSGFIGTYDYTLNPYSGCSFGCSYCYAASFSPNHNIENWGYWVEVKQNALENLITYRKKPIIDKIIYMSSVTDPYQPIENKLKLTRSILQELADYHKVRLVIQTRGKLVTRDIDLIKKIGRVQVNMTITTDNEEIRKDFEPLCPSNEARLKTIKEINDAGIQSCITMTPLLPVKCVPNFITQLKNTGVKKFIIQPLRDNNKHTNYNNTMIARTKYQAIDLSKKYNWTYNEYVKILNKIKLSIPNIGIEKQGFAPPL